MIERRFSRAEVRAEGTDSHPVLTGYAAIFNSTSKPIRTSNGSKFYERCAPGCFTRSLKKGNTVALIQHDITKPLATMSAGTLRCTQDSKGLRVTAELNPNVGYAKDLYENVRSGNCSAMSFMFAANSERSSIWSEDKFEDDSDDDERCMYRTLTDLDDLGDVSFCTSGTGAYDAAYCDARSTFPNGTPSIIERRASGLYTLTDNSEKVRAAILRSNSLL
jgi:HK97 family phage prohead protease